MIAGVRGPAAAKHSPSSRRGAKNPSCRWLRKFVLAQRRSLACLRAGWPWGWELLG